MVMRAVGWKADGRSTTRAVTANHMLHPSWSSCYESGRRAPSDLVRNPCSQLVVVMHTAQTIKHNKAPLQPHQIQNKLGKILPDGMSK